MQNELKTKQDRLDRKNKEINQLADRLDELEKNLPPSFEDDYHSLEIQNDKVNKDLLKY